MPGVLDVFNSDAYGVVALTTAVEKIPFVPGRLARLFRVVPISTWVVLIEYKSGKLALIPTKTRGSGTTTKLPADRTHVRPFVVPHIPYSDALLASDVQGVRAFGTENVLETVNGQLKEKLRRLQQDHEVTHEYHRIGAIQGVVKDADGSTTLMNFFTEFGITEASVDFELDVEETDVRRKCELVRDLIRARLGGSTMRGVEAQVGVGFWNMLVNHPTVIAAWEIWREGEYLRTARREDGVDVNRFVYGGITFELYEGSVGDVDFIPSDQARFYPTNVPDLFLEHHGPADYIETVNTNGKKFYAKQKNMDYDKGIAIDTQSNPCMICTQPDLLVKGETAVVSFT